MLFRRLYNDGLAQASYLIGCPAIGTALVVDPTRDVEQYVRAAAEEGLRITHVAESHIHADFVSGSRELARRCGATLLLSALGGAHWQYAFAGADGATLLADGDRFAVGNVQFQVLHTPGHTPEHLSFLVTDTAVSHNPVGILSGDFLFVGDVGRPDLLERAVGVAGTMEDMARQLYRSLQRLAPLPDYVQIWPGHGAGSACGKALGGSPSSTLGYERTSNWAFASRDEADFVRDVLQGQPEPPPYFARMKTVNRDGAPPARHESVTRLDAASVESLRRCGAWLVDTRPTRQFTGAALKGAVAIPAGRSFLTYAGAVLPNDCGVVLLTGTDDQSAADHLATQLSLIGIDRVLGWAGPDVLQARFCPRSAIAALPLVDVAALSTRPHRVVDVRARHEWNAGHIAGAMHVPLTSLLASAAALGDDLPLVVMCESGTRSVVGASVLRRLGHANVSSLAGGLDAWTAAGLPVHPEERSSHSEEHSDEESTFTS